MANPVDGKCFHCGEKIGPGYTICDKCREKLHENDKEALKAEICDKYCKYPLLWEAKVMGSELRESELCYRCPLGEL